MGKTSWRSDMMSVGRVRNLRSNESTNELPQVRRTDTRLLIACRCAAAAIVERGGFDRKSHACDCKAYIFTGLDLDSPFLEHRPRLEDQNPVASADLHA